MIFVCDAEESEEDKSHIGEVYEDVSPLMKEAVVGGLSGPTVESEFYEDQWGTFFERIRPHIHG